MTWRWALGTLWIASLGALAAWWLFTRRNVDTWRLLPVPAAVLDSRGTVRSRTGPSGGPDLVAVTGLPAPGHVVRAEPRQTARHSRSRGSAAVPSRSPCRVTPWRTVETRCWPNSPHGWPTTSTRPSPP